MKDIVFIKNTLNIEIKLILKNYNHHKNKMKMFFVVRDSGICATIITCPNNFNKQLY